MENSKKIVLPLLALALLPAGCGYNGLVQADEATKQAWGQVQNVYQRRADLIPNLVATVKGSAAHEEKVLVEVTQARASATQVKLETGDLTDPAKVQAFNQAQGQLGTALNHLMVASEKYPDLKANAQFSDLMSQLEGTENRITVERKRYNDAVEAYNVQCRSFPSVIAAKIWGFKVKEPFAAVTANANVAPTVQF